MKRDMDLIREILLKMEENPEPVAGFRSGFEGRTPEEVSYHVKLLNDAGLITARDMTTSRAFYWMPISLTWEGHEFIEASRELSRWEKAKALVKEKTGSLSFAVIKAVLLKLMTDAF